MAVMVDPERQQQNGFGEQAAEGWTSQSFSLGFVTKTLEKLECAYTTTLLLSSSTTRIYHGQDVDGESGRFVSVTPLL